MGLPVFRIAKKNETKKAENVFVQRELKLNS